MFGKYKKTYERNNLIIIFFGYKKNKNNNIVDIELINVIYF